MKRFILMTALAVASASACENKEIAEKPAAEVSEPTAEGEGAQAADGAKAEAVTVPIDQSASKIDWKAAKVSLAHDGGFKQFDGTVSYDAAGKVTGAELTIDTTSVWSDNEKLTGHLKSPDFFAVEQYPKATFKTTNVEQGEGDAVTVTGNLDLHGVTKAVTFPATVKRQGEQVVINADFKINRFDWGIEYKGKPDDLIQKDVNLILHIVTSKPGES